MYRICFSARLFLILNIFTLLLRYLLSFVFLFLSILTAFLMPVSHGVLTRTRWRNVGCLYFHITTARELPHTNPQTTNSYAGEREGVVVGGGREGGGRETDRETETDKTDRERERERERDVQWSQLGGTLVFSLCSKCLK